MTSIAFLGLGAMGARMASRLKGDDINLRVWSRAGVPEGFSSFAPILQTSPTAAVQGADIVIIMVADDDASRAVWLDEGVLGAMGPGAVAVECSTLSPVWVTKLAKYARKTGLAFVDAPVVGSRPEAEAGGLAFLVGGETSTVDSLTPILRRMGNAVYHVGSSPMGAYAKLIANAIFTVQVAAVAEVLGFARRTHMNVEVLVQVLNGLPVLSPSAKGAAAGMLTGSFAPMFPLRLAAKDLRYVLAEADALVSALPMARAANEVFERACAVGLSEENLTTVAKLYWGE